MADDESEMLFDNSCDDASDAEEDDDDYSEFEQPSLAQAPRPFRCLRPDDLREMQAAAVKRVAETLCCEPSDATVLLRSFKWDAERVISSYFENPEGVLEKAGVCGSSNRAVIDAAAAQPYQCPICLEMVTAFSALGCGHRACTPCYSAYVGHKIDDEGTAAVRARCPLVKCRVQLTDALVNALATDAQRARYAVYLERAFVDDHPRLAWCPAPSCTHAILMVQPADGAPLTGAARVACACGEVFCFACLRDDHSPATCEQLRLWLIKCKDDSETYNWLQANTRACPACKTSVEKSGGCNHMTCRHASCGHEWCWVCAGPWKEHSGTRARRARAHGAMRRAPRRVASLTPERPRRVRARAGNFYTCNRFKETDDEEVKRKDLSKAALERYLHYYSRYINHHSSLMLEEKTRQAMEDKIAEMQALGSNWLDGQYLKEARARARPRATGLGHTPLTPARAAVRVPPTRAASCAGDRIAHRVQARAAIHVCVRLLFAGRQPQGALPDGAARFGDDDGGPFRRDREARGADRAPDRPAPPADERETACQPLQRRRGAPRRRGAGRARGRARAGRALAAAVAGVTVTRDS